MADQEYAEDVYYEEGYVGNGEEEQQEAVEGQEYAEDGGEITEEQQQQGEEQQAMENIEYTEFYSVLQGQGVTERLAGKLDLLVQNQFVTPEELDDRALDALKEFNEEDAIQIVDQFARSDLSHVQNKSAFLCGVMKTHRTKTKQKEKAGPEGDEGQTGPNEEKIKELLDRTGYSLDITTGQRKYGGPPPDWEGPAPGQGPKVICKFDIWNWAVKLDETWKFSGFLRRRIFRFQKSDL